MQASQKNPRCRQDDSEWKTMIIVFELSSRRVQQSNKACFMSYFVLPVLLFVTCM